ncbi:sn-glycerol 3-phosphate transport system ATP-binding protein/multiple sugar transport system ATP-binding protein [Kribbella antiqua]|uniref:sn-glycerol 3-phosphate transport system ATP-binding protein/multiple sugar transport system ATP-binding protein n=1 Tax=Kribbella antiqua TaxID=2512217 RepID=A0A4R2IVA6_9ACTN|nr:ABC transporter ATP-binding protein [Kribbella antiqua]TCO49503.1 sn-glycerol 3-phosphate transport system ATP-binding protein/multiple sugar transport system ATP-binding protein [Kribbella antiqua]
MTTGISVRGVRKRYGDTVVLDDLDLEVGAGEFLAVVGPSGCGKSTLMRIVAGIEPLTAGSVVIGGEDVTYAHPGDRGIGMVFQDYALYPHLNVEGNLAFGLRAHRVDKAEVRRRVAATARQIGLTEHLAKKPGQLSGGQRQRVALGRAMIREPRAYLMDEPLSNLDAALRVQMRAELIEFHQRVAGTVLYVTHDQVEAMTMGDRVAVMNGGRFEQIADPTTIYEQPATLFVAGFLGSPRMNFLDAVTGVEGDSVRVTAGPLSWTVPAGQLDGPLPESVVVGFRPETVLPSGSVLPGSAAGQAATFAGDVALREYLGNEAILHLDVDGHRIVSRLPARVAQDAVPFAVDATDLHLFDPAGPALWHGSALRALTGLRQ